MSYPAYTRLLLVALFACRDNSAPPRPPVPIITLTVDGLPRTVSVDRDISLTSLVSAPAAQWTFVRVDARGERFLELDSPATTYPTGELRIYLSERGRERGHVMFGVFVDGAPIAALDRIEQVQVSTRAAPAAPPRTLTIVEHGRERAWTTEARETPLRDVIAGEPRTVRVIGDTEIALASIDNATLKTNQRGEFVLRVWDNGRDHPTREVRRVTKILVE